MQLCWKSGTYVPTSSKVAGKIKIESFKRAQEIGGWDFFVGMNLWVGLLCWHESVGWKLFFFFLSQEQCAILMEHVNQSNVPENQNGDKRSLSTGRGHKGGC